MTRLPRPGQDADIWGEILNDFLSVAHQPDGTLKPSAVPTATVADGSITPAKLSQSYVPSSQKGASNGVATLDGSGKVPAAQLPAASTPADATTNSKGVIKLAGDLDGSADNPTVPGLANKADQNVTITAGTGLTGGGDLSTDRTLAVDFGTTAGTVMAGNDSRIANAEQTSNKGVANGYASLNSSGKVPASQLNIGSRIHPFSNSGNLIAEAGSHRLYNDSGSAWTITSVRASVGITPVGASIIIDINVDGTTIFTTQSNRPTIAAAAYTSGKITNMNVTTVPAGSYLTVDVDQVGLTSPGADLTVQVEVV